MLYLPMYHSNRLKVIKCHKVLGLKLRNEIRKIFQKSLQLSIVEVIVSSRNSRCLALTIHLHICIYVIASQYCDEFINCLW
jgi:hypothetical protein